MAEVTVTHHQYAVAPFSQRPAQKVLDAAWSRAGKAERERGARFMSCGICARPVDADKARHWGIVIDGGASWGTEDSPEDNAHMGAFPIGNDCHRLHVKR